MFGHSLTKSPVFVRTGVVAQQPAVRFYNPLTGAVSPRLGNYPRSYDEEDDDGDVIAEFMMPNTGVSVTLTGKRSHIKRTKKLLQVWDTGLGRETAARNAAENHAVHELDNDTPIMNAVIQTAAQQT
jgi:hypothetical protein